MPFSFVPRCIISFEEKEEKLSKVATIDDDALLKVARIRDRVRRRVTQSGLEKKSPLCQELFRINELWEKLVFSLLEKPQSQERAQEAWLRTQRARRQTFEMTVTTREGEEIDEEEFDLVTEICDQIWTPAVMETVGVSPEQLLEFKKSTQLRLLS